MSRRVVFMAAALVVLSGCAGANPLSGIPGHGGVAGFWAGLWHGLICPIALVISWFNRRVNIYEVHNNGAFYNTAFVFGAGAWGLLRSGSSGDRRRGKGA